MTGCVWLASLSGRLSQIKLKIFTLCCLFVLLTEGLLRNSSQIRRGQPMSSYHSAGRTSIRNSKREDSLSPIPVASSRQRFRSSRLTITYTWTHTLKPGETRVEVFSPPINTHTALGRSISKCPLSCGAPPPSFSDFLIRSHRFCRL